MFLFKLRNVHIFIVNIDCNSSCRNEYQATILINRGEELLVLCVSVCVNMRERERERERERDQSV